MISARPAVSRGRSRCANRIADSVPGARVSDRWATTCPRSGNPVSRMARLRPWPVWFSVRRRRRPGRVHRRDAREPLRSTDRGCTCRRRPTGTGVPRARARPALRPVLRLPRRGRRDRRLPQPQRDRARRASRAPSSATAASPAYAGHGYMSEAMDLLLREAFTELGLHRLEANIQPGNARVDRAGQALRVRARGILAALPEDRRPLAGPRALGDPRRDLARRTLRMRSSLNPAVPGTDIAMEPLIEHSMELAGHRTRVLELEGLRPGNRAPARLGRLRRHLAAAARRARPLRPARDRGRPARASAARRACARARSFRSSTSSPPRSCASGAPGSRS